MRTDDSPLDEPGLVLDREAWASNLNLVSLCPPTLDDLGGLLCTQHRNIWQLQFCRVLSPESHLMHIDKRFVRNTEWTHRPQGMSRCTLTLPVVGVFTRKTNHYSMCNQNKPEGITRHTCTCRMSGSAKSWTGSTKTNCEMVQQRNDFDQIGE